MRTIGGREKKLISYKRDSPQTIHSFCESLSRSTTELRGLLEWPLLFLTALKPPPTPPPPTKPHILTPYHSADPKQGQLGETHKGDRSPLWTIHLNALENTRFWCPLFSLCAPKKLLHSSSLKQLAGSGFLFEELREFYSFCCYCPVIKERTEDFSFKKIYAFYDKMAKIGIVCKRWVAKTISMYSGFSVKNGLLFIHFTHSFVLSFTTEYIDWNLAYIHTDAVKPSQG